jgi:hypothetical protein
MDEQQAKRMTTWIEQIAGEMGVPVPADVEIILDVAKDAAHRVERPAAPVTTYLLGYAVANGADPQSVADLIARLAREFDE